MVLFYPKISLRSKRG